MGTKKIQHAGWMRPCSIRLPIELHAYVLDEAERRGTSTGAVVRDAVAHYKEQHSISQQLTTFESRILRKVFELQCIIAGLTATEREEALRELKQRLKGGTA